MSYNFILFVVFIFTLVIITKPLGTYIFKVFNNERTWLDWFAKPFQRVYLLILGESSKKEQSAKSYFFSLLSFSIMAFIFVFVVLLLQGLLPFNPQEIKGMGFSQAFNTAVSFVTNTNWQSYSGETGLAISHRCLLFLSRTLFQQQLGYVLQ